MSPPGTHFTAESTEAMRIKSLAQGENILMLGIEPSTFVSKIDILTTTPIVQIAPKCVHQDIANLLNEVSETGTYPQELKHELIIPIQKPGKQKWKVENMRPVILLSILQKLLATCFVKRISDKIDSMIPLSQAAFRKVRSATEHVFAMKILCEKAMTSCDYSTYILLLDMTKAFDTINREHLY